MPTKRSSLTQLGQALIPLSPAHATSSAELVPALAFEFCIAATKQYRHTLSRVAPCFVGDAGLEPATIRV